MQTVSDELNKMKCSSFCSIKVKETETKSTSDDQLREKIQRWLSHPNPSINHNTACKAHKDGTATWFLEGPMYKTWKETGKETGSLLWVHGNRTVFRSSRATAADSLWFRSGIWQECSLVGDAQLNLIVVAYIGD